MSPRLTLAVWMDGSQAVAGRLEASDEGALGFAYDEGYLEDGGRPLSLSLPLGEQRFGDAITRAFFENLLPENNQMREVLEREGLDRDDVAGILAHVGADCSGAISVLPQDAEPVKVPGVLAEDYEPLADAMLVEIAESLAERQRLPDAVRDPSPVAGVQRKIALTLLPDGRFALPRPDRRVPTTHILKVPARGEQGDAALEVAAARLASACGFEVASSVTLQLGNAAALLTLRFDRAIVDGVVYRLHQEDFAQALGLPARLKYERNGREGRRFDAAAARSLLDQTATPARDRETFLLATLFNLMVGNNDNHAKNHALLYDRGRTPRLAPLYDLLPVQIHDRYTPELAFHIGTAKAAAAIGRVDLDALFAVFGLASKRRDRFVAERVLPLMEMLEAQSAALQPAGLKLLDDLIGHELARLADLLGVQLLLRERDLFRARGGGWAIS